MADVRVLLAKDMKRYREIFGISQMELAEKIGCSPTLIGKIEIMKRFPSAPPRDTFRTQRYSLLLNCAHYN